MKRLRVHWFQHVPFEGLGSIEPWLRKLDADVSMTAFWRGDVPPPPESFDWLIIMGGPMSVHDEAVHPWLKEEKEITHQAIAQNKTVLGICLGAQLIADVLGGSVTRNPEREIGWFPVEPIAEATAHSIAALLPNAEKVFHWHGETFAPPAGATPLSRSAACANQAFSVGDHVIGLQFHMETTPESARALLEHCSEDLKPGAFVQSPEEIAGQPEFFAGINAAMDRLLDALVSRLP